MPRVLPGRGEAIHEAPGAPHDASSCPEPAWRHKPALSSFGRRRVTEAGF